MNNNKHIKRISAWILLAIFTSVLIIKDFHSHHEEEGVRSHVVDDGTMPIVKATCFVCDFSLYKASTPKIQTFKPLVCVVICTPYIITEQIVYRHIDAVNSHSPPFKA
jgi:hypothetical protein